MSFEKHEATASSYPFKRKMYLQTLKTVHVRWPDKWPACPAIGGRAFICP